MTGTPIVRDNPPRHRFEIDLGDGTFAFAQYTLAVGTITFTHTKVPTAHEGQGLGTLLVRSALASAQDRGLRIIPLCPFFAAYFRKHPEVQSLLDASYRDTPQNSPD